MTRGGSRPSCSGARRARACYVMAHGAGAGMAHPFMAACGRARRARHRHAALSVPLHGAGAGPTRRKLAQAAVRAAVAAAAKLLPALPLFAGGKSFGGRMTSQAQAAPPLPGVRGLGLPRLPAASGRQAVGRARPAPARRAGADAVPAGHARRPGRPDAARAGGRRLGERATLRPVEDADHAFHVPARSGRGADGALDVLDAAARWVVRILDRAYWRRAPGRALQPGDRPADRAPASTSPDADLSSPTGRLRGPVRDRSDHARSFH